MQHFGLKYGIHDFKEIMNPKMLKHFGYKRSNTSTYFTELKGFLMKTKYKFIVLAVGKDHNNEPVSFRVCHTSGASLYGMGSEVMAVAAIHPSPGLFFISSRVRAYKDGVLIASSSSGLRFANNRSLESFLELPEDKRMSMIGESLSREIQRLRKPSKDIFEMLQRDLRAAGMIGMGSPVPNEPGIKMFSLNKPSANDPDNNGGLN